MSVEEIVRLVGFFYEKIVSKEMYALSFREVLSLFRVPIPQRLPLPSKETQRGGELLIRCIHDSLQEEIKIGIGYKRKTYLNWMRGTHLKRVKDHLRCEVVMTKGKYKPIQYVEVGESYASEVKLLRRILEEVEVKGKRFLADRL